MFPVYILVYSNLCLRQVQLRHLASQYLLSRCLPYRLSILLSRHRVPLRLSASTSASTSSLSNILSPICCCVVVVLLLLLLLGRSGARPKEGPPVMNPLRLRVCPSISRRSHLRSFLSNHPKPSGWISVHVLVHSEPA